MWLEHLPKLLSCVSVGCLWGQKGQRITKDPPQQQPVSFNEASEGGHLTPYYIILQLTLEHCLWPSPSHSMLEIIL